MHFFSKVITGFFLRGFKKTVSDIKTKLRTKILVLIPNLLFGICLRLKCENLFPLHSFT